VFETVLPEIRAVMGVECMFIYTPVLHIEGWELARYHSSGLPNNAKLKQLFTRFLAGAPARFGEYDATRPEPEQRNRVIDPFAKPLLNEELSLSPYRRAVFVPLRLEHHRQLRVLLCDGADLLAWFGTLHPEPFEPRHRRILHALVPSLHRRLVIERRMNASELDRRALDVALEQLGGPAFILSSSGRLSHANGAGHALLATRNADVRSALRDVLAGRASALAFSVTRLDERGGSTAWLATLRARSAQDQIALCVANAARRWRLTARQRAVMQAIVEGDANATIAAASNTTERAVEQHVSALFDCTGVDSRAALVARVLLE
jgi:DNA-binding NarL/FixJ family response regulator